jgi:Zn-dependent protease
MNFMEYRPGDYSPPSYDDPHFYDLRQEDPVVSALPEPAEGVEDAQFGSVLTDEYRGPDELERSATEEGEERREEVEWGKVDGPDDPRNNKKKRLAGLGGLGATVVGLLLKFKMLMLVLLDIKWVAFLGKFGLASISALISVAVYSRLFGWSFAVGLVGLLFIHEMGHAIVMKLKGIPVGGMIFIPMLGAAVFMRQMPGNAKDEAEVGIAGPLAGALVALVCLLLARSQMGSTGLAGIWGPLAYFGCFLNLFNLLPMMPFDGGRVLAAIDRRIWILGFLMLIAIQVWQWLTGSSSIWLLLFIIIGATDFWARRRSWKAPETRAYYSVPIGERIIIGLAYFALAVALVIGMTLAHSMMFQR